MRSRVAAAAGAVTAAVVWAAGYWFAGDAALAGAVALVYGVALGVVLRWEPVARRRGLWGEGGLADRDGGLVAVGVVALSMGAALAVHPGLGLDAETRLLVRLLIVGTGIAGLYLGVAAVLIARGAADPAPATGPVEESG